MSTGAFSRAVSGTLRFSTRFVLSKYASQARTHWEHIGNARRTASLDHCCYLHPRICHLLVHSNLLHKTFPYRMLHHSRNQLDLLRSDSLRLLSDMPTFGLQLGSVHSRNMRRPEVLGSIHRSFQLVDGHRHRRTTHARFMGAANANCKEGRSERDVFYGHSVRTTFFLSSLSLLEARLARKLLTLTCSICIITLVRIKVTNDITAKNTAAQYELIALLTNLESSLGMVNACLPVTKPAFEKLKSTSSIRGLLEWTSSKRSSVRSGEYEMPSKRKEIGWQLGDQPKRVMRRNSHDSAIDLPNAVWTPPLSQRKEVWD